MTWSVASFATLEVLPGVHLEGDLTGNETREILKQYLNHPNHQTAKTIQFHSMAQVAPIIQMGERLLKWVDHINGSRPSNQLLSLSSKTTQAAFPIESPRIYNERIVQSEYQTVMAAAPAWLTSVVIDGKPYPATVPVDDVEFIKQARPAERIYSLAARWAMLEPSVLFLKARAAQDVRGYYFLKQEPDLQSKLDQYESLESGKKAELKKWLVGLCQNASLSLSTCQSRFQSASARTHYQKYLPYGEETWEDFFKLDVRRSDVDWLSGSSPILSIPFIDPSTTEVRDFLVDNIEDEWKWNAWQLRLDFVPSGSHAFIRFIAGTVPNVNRLGGNQVTMDANAPLTEYDAQWTIRHEFGHVLGFPDCYHEFYDESLGAIVNYQLDTSNIMCSRRGRLQETHFQALKQVYGP